MPRTNLKESLINEVNDLIAEREQLNSLIINNYTKLTYEELELFIESKYLIEKDIFFYRTKSKITSYKLMKLSMTLENTLNRSRGLIEKYNLNKI